MDKEKLLGAIQPDKLKPWIAQSMQKAGVTSVEMLRDDKKVEQVADFTYDSIPFAPRMAIKVTIGKKGFVKLFFRIRDKMVDMGSLDLSWLKLDFLKSSILSKL